MEDIIIQIFDNIEYVLVDTYELDKTIYHFKNEDNEVFCYNKNGVYKKIDDKELIEKLKNKIDLKDADIKCLL